MLNSPFRTAFVLPACLCGQRTHAFPLTPLHTAVRDCFTHAILIGPFMLDVPSLTERPPFIRSAPSYTQPPRYQVSSTRSPPLTTPPAKNGYDALPETTELSYQSLLSSRWR